MTMTVASWKRPRRLAPGVLACLVATVVLSQASCSFFVTSTKDQCSTDSDCTGKGPDFASTVCSPDLHTCIEKAGYCTSNLECIQRTNGAPYFCDKTPGIAASNTCVALLSPTNGTPPACDYFIGATIDPNNPVGLGDDNVLILGYSGAMSGAFAAAGAGNRHMVEIASHEFNTVITSIPSVNGSPARPVVWVGCDEAGPDPTGNINHLINDLHVPAIVGPHLSQTALTLFNNVIEPAHELSIAPIAATALLVSPPGKQQYMYRLNAADDEGSLTQALITQYVLEPRVRAAGEVTSGSPIKVALVYGTDAFSVVTQPLVEGYLNFNGQSATSQLNQNYFPIKAGDPTDKTNYASEQAAAVTAVIAAKPHVIILVSANVGSGSIITPVEQGWSQAGVSYLPQWVIPLTLTAATSWPQILSNIPGGDVAANQGRFLLSLEGPIFAGPKAEPHAAALYAKYVAGTYPATDAFGFTAPLTYDATWMLLLSTVATAYEGKPLTPDNISPSFHLLQGPGTAYSPDVQSSMQTASADLAANRSIVYVGASGPCTFDQYNDARPGMHVGCVGPVGTPGPPNRADYGGMDVNIATKTLSGTLNPQICQ